MIKRLGGLIGIFDSEFVSQPRGGSVNVTLGAWHFIAITSCVILLSANALGAAVKSEPGYLRYGVCEDARVSVGATTPVFQFVQPSTPNIASLIETEWAKRNGRLKEDHDFLCLFYDTLESAQRRFGNPPPDKILRSWLPSMAELAGSAPASRSVQATPAAPSITQAKPSKGQAGPPQTINPAPAVPKGPTPNELKYRRELEAYNTRLAEIERIKAETAAKHAADKAQAEQEMARHRQQQAQADAAKRKYDQELAAHQQLVRDRETKQDREQKVDWREAVVVCALNTGDGQSQFGNWRCDGPLQMTYAKLGSPGTAPSTQAIVALSQACGGSREAVRDLGMVSSSRLFGCSYGIHPKSTGGSPIDTAAKHGIGYIPGRATYRCPTYQSGCRTQ